MPPFLSLPGDVGRAIALLQDIGLGAGWAFVWLLCAVGIGLCCLTLSGTWLVTLAALIAVPLSGDAFPGIGAVLGFAGVCVAVEVGENLAGYLGVKQRGGSGWAGVAAAIGGLGGLLAGSLIPAPVLGSLLGMLAGCFLGALGVEWRRLKRSRPALRIAFGAVVARIAVLLLKVVTALGLSAALLIGVLRGG
jgi:uncharacterized protein YqgC (DUF456 family)